MAKLSSNQILNGVSATNAQYLSDYKQIAPQIRLERGSFLADVFTEPKTPQL
jgi:hypothetical protein